jgi:uncharacterized membrane protein
MFFWFSSGGGRSNIGCCGGSLLLLPLGFLTFSGGLGNNGFLLMLIVIAVLAGLFILPRFRDAAASGEKRKNDERYATYEEKPKRDDERYILTDDGEIIESSDDRSIL